ncbi:MAG: hypothetical protein WCF67_23600 [Chitinophagaceae bacterium]
MAITEDQLKVYEVLTNLALKVVVTICILIAFFIILRFVISAKTWEDRAVFAALDGILGGTMFVLVRHFFPAIKMATNAEKRTKKISPPSK